MKWLIIFIILTLIGCEKMKIYSPYTNVVTSIPYTLYDTGKTEVWYDASDTSTLTKNIVTGEVSRWNDKLGSGHDLVQATEIKQPIWSNNEIIFDGSNDFMRTDQWTIGQPMCIYVVMKQITWTGYGMFWDGYTKSRCLLHQGTETPRIGAAAGKTGHEPTYTFGINQYAILRVFYNGANSSLQVNNWIKKVADWGSDIPDGFNLGSQNSISYWANMGIKEMIVRTVVDDDSVQTDIVNYLANKWEIDLDTDKKKPMIAMTCDDSYDDSYTVIYPILQEYGLKGSFAIATGWVNGEGAITSAQLIDMQNHGHEIMSHSVSHPDDGLGSLDLEDLTYELTQSKVALEAWGLDIHNFCYPGPSYSEYVETEALKYYESALRGGNASTGRVILPIDMGSTIYRAGLDYCTTENITDLIDRCISDNGNSILLFYTHAYPFNSVTEEKFRLVCSYVKSNNLRLYTVKEMLDVVRSYSLYYTL